MKPLETLKEHRSHLEYVLNNVELSDHARTIFEALLIEIDEQIMAAQKPN